MIKVDKTITRNYIVGDFGGRLRTFEKLKDARNYLKEVGKGRQAYIESCTTEVISISTTEVIQTLR